METKLTGFSTKIYLAISKDKIFQKGSSQSATICNEPDGYTALFKLIMPHHPAYVLHPSDLIRTTPSQDLKDDISTYFYRYIDFMQLRGYLENNSKTLDDPYEMDKFISGATYSKEILHLTRDNRRSTDPAILAQYSQSRIVGDRFQSYVIGFELFCDEI